MAIRMSRKTWVIVAVAVIAVGAAVGITLSRNSSSPSDLTLPVITWNDTSLSELQGTPVALNFWSISCPYCVQQLPYLENAARQSEGELKVIAINIRDSASRIQTFFGDYNPTMTIARDSGAKAFRDYCLAYNNTRAAIPFTLFVDSDGTVRDTKIGAFASEQALWNTLSDILGITIPQTS